MVVTLSRERNVEFAYQPEKLEQAILYFLDRSNNGHLGKTKLMKLLYYADFDHVERYGDPITGARYRKLEQGPVPWEARDTLDRMVSNGWIKPETREVGSYVQYRYIPLVAPDHEAFSDEERETLAQVAARWENEPLSRIVAATHAEAPWLSVRMGDDIPYTLAHFRSSLGGGYHHEPRRD